MINGVDSFSFRECSEFAASRHSVNLHGIRDGDERADISRFGDTMTDLV